MPNSSLNRPWARLTLGLPLLLSTAQTDGKLWNDPIRTEKTERGPRASFSPIGRLRHDPLQKDSSFPSGELAWRNCPQVVTFAQTPQLVESLLISAGAVVALGCDRSPLSGLPLSAPRAFLPQPVLQPAGQELRQERPVCAHLGCGSLTGEDTSRAPGGMLCGLWVNRWYLRGR